MVIFHCYVSLPGGTFIYKSFWLKNHFGMFGNARYIHSSIDEKSLNDKQNELYIVHVADVFPFLGPRVDLQWFSHLWGKFLQHHIIKGL